MFSLTQQTSVSVPELYWEISVIVLVFVYMFLFSVLQHMCDVNRYYPSAHHKILSTFTPYYASTNNTNSLTVVLKWNCLILAKVKTTP